MAEFLNQPPVEVGARVISTVDAVGVDGFAAMGRPIPSHRRQAGFDHCVQMGLGTDVAWAVVGLVADRLERDRPYDAMKEGMRALDLTGTYRLMAVLLTAPEPPAAEPAADAQPAAADAGPEAPAAGRLWSDYLPRRSAP